MIRPGAALCRRVLFSERFRRMSSSAICAEPVQVRQHQLVIPSAPVRLGRLPAIGPAALDRPIHPYRMLSDIDFGRFEQRSFVALTLENEFLRLTVLPELGGRLHRAIYKPAGYDLFYHNDAIRAQLVSSRGAWYAGGVEFNFPVSHSLTTHTGVEYATGKYADGSAAIFLANTCRMSRMRWQVAIRLAPASSAIAFHTRLLNRTAWPQRYYYWLNAAVPQGPQIRYHFSASKLVGHTQEVGGTVTRLDSFPMMRNGSDARIPAKLRDTTSVFMLDNNSGFFGYYDLDADLGLVRSAPVRDVPGNKIWSWGDTDYGNRFNQRLVPPGGQYYGELQSGRPESQTDWAIIEPFEVIEAAETWYPIPKLGGMTDGSRELAVLAEPSDGKVRLLANRRFASLRVCVLPFRSTASAAHGSEKQAPGPVVERLLRDLRPDQPAELLFQPTSEPIRVLIRDADGRVVLDYRDLANRPGSIITDLYEAKASAGAPATPHQHVVRGLLAYRAFEWSRAVESFQHALSMDANFAPAHRWLGFMRRLAGRPADATKHLKAALLCDPMDYAAYYQYAALLLETGSLEQAVLELQRVIGYAHGQYRQWAAVLLVRALLRLGRNDEAMRLLDDRPAESAIGPLARLAYRVQPQSAFARAVKALGKASGEAGADAEPADGQSNHLCPWMDGPTDLFCRLVVSDVAKVLDAWWGQNVKPADDAADAALEAVDELLDIGDADRARAVLDWVTGHETLGRACPLAHYMLGELCGDLPAAVRRAGELTDRSRMAWPGALSQLPLLERAVASAPDDGLAQSLLGMLRLAIGLPEQAGESLDAATRLDANDALAWRNLALARWQLAGVDATADNRWQPALAAYRRAIAAWPDCDVLVGECDRMLGRLRGPNAERRKLLYDQLDPLLAGSDMIAIRRAHLALAEGEFKVGLDELLGRQFHPGEAGWDTHRLFARLSIRQGELLAGQGHWQGALDMFRQSLTYPKNFGIGRPRRAQESRQFWLIATAMEHLGQADAAREQLEALVSACLRYVPLELYFGVLALRKLGRHEQAEQWLKLLVEQTDRRAGNATADSRFWAVVGQALIRRANGDRQSSNDHLAGLALNPGSDLSDLLDSDLY